MRVGDPRSRKIPAQRQAELRKLLKSRGAASVAEIASAMDVSESTARRDIDKLTKEGIVSRSHGGAVIVDPTTFEPLFRDRQLQNTEEKARIGRHAVTLLRPGQSVIFDSFLHGIKLNPKFVTKPCSVNGRYERCQRSCSARARSSSKRDLARR